MNRLRLTNASLVVDGHHAVHGGASLVAWLLGQGAQVTVAGAEQSERTDDLKRLVDEQLKRSSHDGRQYRAMCGRLSWTARRLRGTLDARQLFVDAWPRRVFAVAGPHGKTTTALWAAHLIRDAVVVGHSPERSPVMSLNSRARIAILETSDREPPQGPRLAVIDIAGDPGPVPVLARIDADAFASRWGSHNIANLTAAVRIATLAGIPAVDIVRRIGSLPQAPYRQEVIHRDAKLTVVNDATASTPTAGVAALLRWGGPTTVLIAGGSGGVADYNVWAEELSVAIRKTNLRLLMGDATRCMRSALRKVGYTAPAFDTLPEAWAAALARAETYVSATVVYSPATPGDPLERGRLFNDLVLHRPRVR